MVPNGWVKTTFGKITKIGNGQVDPKVEPYSSMTHIGPENVVSNTGQITNLKSCSALGLISGKYEFDENSIVYSKIRPNLNKVCRPDFKGVCSADMYPIWSEDNLDINYLYHYMLGPYFNRIAIAMSMRTGMPKINRSDLNSLSIVLPPLPEQRKIAQILSTWDRGIATTEKLIDASKQQKKALMQQLLTGKKRLVDPETGKAFEGDWEEVKLGDLGKTFTGLTGKTKEHFGKGSKYIPYINIFRNSSVDMNALELVDVLPNEKQNLVKYGDIFFTTSSETPEEVGMSSVILEEIDESVYLNSFCFGFRPHNFNRVKPEFICYLLRSEKVRRSISLLAQGATRYNLSKTQLLKITLNIPSLGEQQKIASVLTTADKDIELLEAKLAHFKQEKKALMQQLLTGKRRVKVAEAEAA
ncbi:restriction endonuclease subunit S [Vibrio parahaemolyticus]|uniref:Type I restriction-modification system, specificity subunit S n=1 Tax=Vibrio jasicida TaxID=766224 RepID=A0AAU9QVP0_9VIBR|nr:restriction endonuclease subunit S [Vibrio parahaemolyticus]MCR9655949.1 restriction endonuclease subunit S [Vibrio parahaemolyticus]CAH1601030.1 Type I restriction-modification system, specificity subunit S [Vibrio jasicida]CAH1603199.1 Type I restriction-modification system, specificity subunit S [Vibrio jasicida]